MNYYENTLQEGQNLIEAAPGFAPTYFRDHEIASVFDALCKNRSVLLVGPSGVGKTAVLQGVARRLADATAIGLRRFTTTQIISGTKYLGEWQSKLTRLMAEVEQPKAVINLVDVWNLPSVGVTAQNRENFLDAMRPRLVDGRLQLISELTAEQLHELYRVPKFISLFELVRIEPLSEQQVREIIDRDAASNELTITLETRERLFSLCATFSPANAGPGPALDLLHKVRDYRIEKLAAGEEAEITPPFVERVFAIHSGLPMFVISQTEHKSSADIRDWFRERIIGQEAAIDAVVEMIAFYKARLHDKGKPVGSFLFVGPTGVGKTELARALAEFFFGSERRMLRFDMSEFADYNSFEMLIGSAYAGPERPARLLDPVRLQPFQVLLFDELEKSHRNVQDLFLQLLDEGRLTSPRGETVNFRNTIIVATSNVGAFEGMTTAIGFGQKGEAYDPDKALRAIEGWFRPEFLNRFQHVVLFHPLTREQAVRIARIDLNSVLRREGIAAQNLIVDVHDDVIDHVLAVGFNPRYGGRGIKREVRRQILLPLATLLMERSLEPGTLIDVSISGGRVRMRTVDTPESASAKAERAPVRTRSGERLTRDNLRARMIAARKDYELLAVAANLDRLRERIEEVDGQRKDYTFWHDPDEAARILAQQTCWLEAVSRIERLNDALQELEAAFDSRMTRTDLVQMANNLLHLESTLAVVRRELVRMGPDGHWDALMEILPVGSNSAARNFIFDVYEKWAKERRLELLILHEPMTPEEPIAVALRGHFAFGYLKAEAGHHRLRREKDSSVARVRVAPLSGGAGAVEFAEQRALKKVGQLGGKIRSRVAIAGSKLVLQHARTISENRELARELAVTGSPEETAACSNVRRYDLSPFRVRDYLTEANFTRKDILSPKSFHELLCARIDALADSSNQGEAASK
jgi:ATP-dependent Clp protease ATP-binding subunit ClpC